MGPARFLPPRLLSDGYPVLALNMRCHDLGYTRGDIPFRGVEVDDCLMDGGAWERLSEGRWDVAAAVEALRARGCARVVVVGHSSGGFYAADYAAHAPDLDGVGLLSPVVTNQRPFRYWFADDAARDETIARARALVAAGQGHQLIAVPRWFHAISAASLVERADERPGWFEGNLARLKLPTLLVYGDQESGGPFWERLFASVPAARKTRVVVASEHAYVGQVVRVAAALREFLAGV
jgi:pimeloyl-ACP methyl ester carboxylesterase